MTQPYGDQIIVTTRTQTGLDEYGNPVYHETSVTVIGAFAPSPGTETLTNQDQVVSLPQVFLPTGTVIDSDAKLTIGGLDYEVAGEPESWGSPFTGWKPGVRVTLRRVTG